MGVNVYHEINGEDVNQCKEALPREFSSTAEKSIIISNHGSWTILTTGNLFFPCTQKKNNCTIALLFLLSMVPHVVLAQASAQRFKQDAFSPSSALRGCYHPTNNLVSPTLVIQKQIGKLGFSQP